MESILNWWNNLPQEVRSGIISTVIGGVALAIIATIFKFSGKSLGAIIRRIFRGGTDSNQIAQPQRQEVIIKVEQPAPPSQPVQPPLPIKNVVTNVPRPPAVGFVARRSKEGRDIVEQLKEELTPQKKQLVVLWGKGGVGKTTLAGEAAREMSDIFGSRIVWTSADGREDFSLSTLLDDTATQLGSPDTRRLALEPKKDEVRALIATQSTLIVLDNFETISTAEQTNCARWIDEAAPCPALITTRTMIDVAHNISIDAMSPEEAREYLSRLIEQTGNPRAFKGLNREQIIRAADANPLVMRWVVARISRAQQSRNVLEELSRGEGDAARRVFDRSFNLPQLGDDGRATLLALSLFVHSASHESLAEIAGFDSGVKRLNEAVERLAVLCLVETTDGGERLVIEGLTRQLAKARLLRDDRANEFRRRFVAYFVRFAESHAKTTKEDFDALEVEKDNMLGAMDVAFEIEDWGSVGRLRFAVEEFLDLHGYWDEAIQRGEQAAQAAQAMNDERGVLVFSSNTAAILYRRGEYDEARNLYRQTLDVLKKLKREEDIAVILHQLAIIAQNDGEIDEARRLYNESLEIEKKLGNQSGIAGALHELGRLSQSQGEIDEAKRLYDESLDIKKKLGDQDGIAITLGQLGLLAEEEGDNAEAARLFREALTIFERLKSPNAKIAWQSLERIKGKS